MTGRQAVSGSGGAGSGVPSGCDSMDSGPLYDRRKAGLWHRRKTGLNDKTNRPQGER